VNEITITPKLEQKFQLVKVVSTGKNATVTKFDKVRNSEGNYVVEFKVVAPASPGSRVYEQLIVSTDLPGDPELKFPIFGNVEGTAVAGATPVSTAQTGDGEKVVLPMAMASELPDGPIIQFDKMTFDIGKVLEGSKTKVTFGFKNTGIADLKITKVKAMCGCTEAKATQSVIPAGKSAAIQVVFDSTGFKSAIDKPVLVATNDQSHKTVRLVIVGEVKPIATVKPDSLSFGQMSAGDVSATKLVITPMPSMKFKILRAESSGNHVSITQFAKTPDKKGAFTATIKLKAGNAAGKVQEWARFITDLPGNPAVSFQVYGNVMGGTAAKNAKTP
jgi:hypothetical protein